MQNSELDSALENLMNDYYHIVAQLDHSGEYICEAVGYPSSTPGSQTTVYLTVEKCKCNSIHYHVCSRTFAHVLVEFIILQIYHSLLPLHKVWSKYNFIEPNKKLRYGIVPHIDFEFFGPGIVGNLKK